MANVSLELQTNYVENNLWIQSFYKDNLCGPYLLEVVHNNNQNECSNNFLKGSAIYRLTSENVIDICRFIRVLESWDEEDYRTVSGHNGLRQVIIALFRQKGKKRSRC